eukprot:7228327-Prorocentrum_lima.AAC.1
MKSCATSPQRPTLKKRLDVYRGGGVMDEAQASSAGGGSFLTFQANAHALAEFWQSGRPAT